jgi:hypothetical protein
VELEELGSRARHHGRPPFCQFATSNRAVKVVGYAQPVQNGSPDRLLHAHWQIFGQQIDLPLGHSQRCCPLGHPFPDSVTPRTRGHHVDEEPPGVTAAACVGRCITPLLPHQGRSSRSLSRGWLAAAELSEVVRRSPVVIDADADSHTGGRARCPPSSSHDGIDCLTGQRDGRLAALWQ